MTSGITQRAFPTSLAVTSRWLFGRIFWRMRWFLGILAVVLLVAYPVLRSLVTDVVSLWEVTGDNAPKWFLFAMGITLVKVYLAPLVAAGVTRARVAAAAAIALLGAATVLALLAPLGFMIEAMYGKTFGWEPVLQFGHLFTSTGQPLAVIAEYLLSGTLYAYTGLLVGFTYYRTNWLIATLLLPFTTAVPWGFAGLLSDRYGSWPSWMTGLGTGPRAGMMLLLVVAVFALVRWLLPKTPLRSRTE